MFEPNIQNSDRIQKREVMRDGRRLASMKLEKMKKRKIQGAHVNQYWSGLNGRLLKL